jgi:hypothetical protein
MPDLPAALRRKQQTAAMRRLHRASSLAGIFRWPFRDVRFTPESGHPSARLALPLWANSGHSPVYLDPEQAGVLTATTWTKSSRSLLALWQSQSGASSNGFLGFRLVNSGHSPVYLDPEQAGVLTATTWTKSSRSLLALWQSQSGASSNGFLGFRLVN